MSIHKSKGLEFPVVFLSNTSKQFNLMDLNNNLLLHQDIGIGVKYIDYDRQIEYDTLSKLAIRNKLYQETLSEEMRILYVALTRAKEKLVITAISKDYEKEINDMQEIVDSYEKINNKINPIVVKKYKKYIDWIKLVYLYDEKLRNLSKLNIYEKDKLLKDLNNKNEDKENILDAFKTLDKVEENTDNINKIRDILEQEYKYKNSINIPSKTSVTKIKELDQNKNINEKIYNIDSNLLVKPKFMQEEIKEVLTSAQKGTLVHLCMQKLDYKKEYQIKDIEWLINNLLENEIITKKEAESININKIFKFTKSDIWKELKTAKEVYKEKPFYININSNDIYINNASEEILVQGIIDLYYIDKYNNLILVDYKTDYVEIGREEVLIDKYKKQLELYKQALENALNKKVEKTYIYSVYLDKPIEINL